MNSLHARELQEILLRYPFQSLVVSLPVQVRESVPCRSRLFSLQRDRKIMYRIAEVEVV